MSMAEEERKAFKEKGQRIMQALADDFAAAIATALQGTSSANPTFTPPTPKIGGIAKINNVELCAWTGGKPKRDWSALDPGAPKTSDMGMMVCNGGQHLCGFPCEVGGP